MNATVFLTFLHILVAAIIVGGEIFIQCIVFPVLAKQKKEITKDDPLVKIYDTSIPVVFGLVTVVAMTGIVKMFSLYDYLRDAHGNMLLFLGVKICLMMVLFAVSAYQTFSLRAKMTGLHPFQKETSPTESLVKKSRSCSFIIITCTITGLLLGIMMS